MRLSVFKRAFKKDIQILRVTYVVLLIAFVGCIFFISKSVFEGEGNSIKDSFTNRYKVIESAIFADTSKGPEINQLRELYSFISHAKEVNIITAVNYNAYGFSFTVLFAIFSVISGILGFLILRKGWDNVNNFYLKSSFLVAFFFSTVFGILPNVFNNKKNTEENLKNFFYYNELQIDIYTLVKDNKGYFKRNTTASLDSLRKEIISINEQMKKNQDLFFEINLDRIPTSTKPFE